MAGRSGGRGRGSSSSYRHEIGSNVSSSSGTIASRLSSSAYTSRSSRLSTFSMEAVAMHFDSLEIHEEHDGYNVDDYDGDIRFCEWEWEEGSRKDLVDRIRSLVQEFFFSAPSANCSSISKRGDMSAVERWLEQLGVKWVLSLVDGASAREELDHDVWLWIRALNKIVQTICFTGPLLPDRGSVGLPSTCNNGGEERAAGDQSLPDLHHLVVFIQEAMLKMLAFVDALVAWDPYATEQFLSRDSVMLLPYTNSKLSSLLDVHDALCEASNKILALFDSKTSVEVKGIEKEMAILLSAYKSKSAEAMRSTMDKFRAMLMEDGDDLSILLNPQGSSDIHNLTESIMTYVEGRMSLNIACTENIELLGNVVVGMVSCLQEKLVNISESFPDRGLRFLFLLNNSYKIQQTFHSHYHEGPAVLAIDLAHEIEGYMKRYLQVSWAQLLSCLMDPTPLCLGKACSPLSKFESEFQKIYTTQKQWKVPDPKLRRWLREVITDKIIPGYTEYIEENKVTNPKFSPQGLKSKLHELFEG